MRMMSSGTVTLGGIADKITMSPVSRCERPGRLSVAKLIERHGAAYQSQDAGDCRRIGGVIYEQCGVHYPQLVRLWRGEPPD